MSGVNVVFVLPVGEAGSLGEAPTARKVVNAARVVCLDGTAQIFLVLGA